MFRQKKFGPRTKVWAEKKLRVKKSVGQKKFGPKKSLGTAKLVQPRLENNIFDLKLF